jgi:hypothetical protein
MILGLRGRFSPDGPLLQLQALHHRRRIPGDAGAPHRPRPAVQRGHLRPGRTALPRGDRRQRQPARPIAAAHMHVGLNAADVAMQAFNLALGASPDHRRAATWPAPASNRRSATTCGPGSCPTVPPTPSLRSTATGSAVRPAVSATAWTSGATRWASAPKGSIADIEILESWYPLLFTERRARPGSGGAGVHRAGGRDPAQPCAAWRRADQRDHVRHAPVAAAPGHRRRAPGRCNEFLVHHSDGTTDELDPNSAGTPMRQGTRSRCAWPVGGGFGDALDRAPESVAVDVAAGRFSAEDADRIYGTVLAADGSADLAATATRRDAHAPGPPGPGHTPLRPHGDRETPAASESSFPLYPGVVQQGNPGLRRGERPGAGRGTTPLDRRLPGARGAAVARRWSRRGLPVPTSTRSRAGLSTSRWHWPAARAPSRSIRAAGPTRPSSEAIRAARPGVRHRRRAIGGG